MASVEGRPFVREAIVTWISVVMVTEWMRPSLSAGVSGADLAHKCVVIFSVFKEDV